MNQQTTDAGSSFRQVLVEILDTLSDEHRHALHFLIGNDTKRQLRDNTSFNGTLDLLESLFDRGKISEQHFNYLIDRFEGIGCITAAKRLREHAKDGEKDTKAEQLPLFQLIASDMEEDSGCRERLLQPPLEPKPTVESSSSLLAIPSAKVSDNIREEPSVNWQLSHLENKPTLATHKHSLKILSGFAILVIVSASLLFVYVL